MDHASLWDNHAYLLNQYIPLSYLYGYIETIIHSPLLYMYRIYEVSVHFIHPYCILIFLISFHSIGPFVMTVNQGKTSEPVPKSFLQCQVQLDGNYQSNQFDLIWIDPQGDNIENSTGVATSITVSNEFIVLKAVFNASAVQQRGEYLCTMSLNIPNTNQVLSQVLGITSNQSGPSGMP